MQFIPLVLLVSLVFHFCTRQWDEHYGSPEETVDMNLWDAIREDPRHELYVSYMEKYGMDLLVKSGKPLTLFIPGDDALALLADTGNVIPRTLAYHISPAVFLVRNVTTQRKLLTESGKYVVIEASPQGHNFDGISVVYESPLYINGKYYEIAEVAEPRPNLYEFVSLYSNVIREYIDLQDSVYLDLSASRPLGFDEAGNTIYDSVMGMVNLFEKYYFPVKEEFRDKRATFILFTQEQYKAALDEMASRLAGSFHTHEDIPRHWQHEVLLPEMMKIGLFDDMLDYSEFMRDTLKNIRGDSVVIRHTGIDPQSRFECSNGLIYTYSDFSVPLNLYLYPIRQEGEHLVDSIGAGRFAWKSQVKVTGSNVEPVSMTTPFESLVNVDLGRNYSGQYTVEFPVRNVWPARYRIVWRANYRPSGIYAVYVNDVLVGQFDTFNLRSSVLSVTGERFMPSSNGFNRKDFWVDHITEFGDVNIRFEYLGSGLSTTNGLNIDYIELIPVIE